MSSISHAAQPVPVRPVFSLRNLVTIARSTFEPGQTQLLVPSILDGFATELTGTEVADRLQLLWLMRREVATQVRDIILLGQVRREPPGAVLLELLKLVSMKTCRQHLDERGVRSGRCGWVNSYAPTAG